MKINFIALLAFLFGMSTTPISAQVSFTKGEIVKKSYASATMVVPPVLGKSDNGFVILSSGLMSAKKIVQLNLDQSMNQLGEEKVVKLPKGKTLRSILNIDNQMIAILWSGKKSDPFECYNFDTGNSSFGDLLLSIPVDEYPGREDLEISLVNDDFEESLGFIIRPKTEYSNVFRKVVVTARTMNKLIWSEVVTDPMVPAAELLGDFELSDLYFNDAHTFVARFTRPFLSGEKEEILTDMYHYNGSKTANIWHDQVIRLTLKEEPLSLPIPYVSKNDKVEVYKLHLDKVKSGLELIKFDIRGDEIERFPFAAKLDGLKTINRIGIYHHLFPMNETFEQGKFCILISEQMNQYELTYGNGSADRKQFIASFGVNDDGLKDDKIMDVGWPDAFSTGPDDRIMLSNSMNSIVNGQMVSLEQQEVFNNFQPATKKAQTGVTYHYVIGSELYSFHSEYGAGSMSSQLVKWNFE